MRIESKTASCILRILPLALALGVFGAQMSAQQIRLTAKEADEIARKVWRNECGGTISGLTSWNAGENFASLGIGHFIWYPKGVRGPFEESFPKLLAFLKSRGAKLPAWLGSDMPCPWSSRIEFERDAGGARMRELRGMLASTLQLQAEFLVQRLENALPKMLAAASPENRDKVRAQFYRVLDSGAAGTFALIDYVNFKGEGVLETERYRGHGWGLLQVLEEMFGTGAPVRDFSDSASRILTRRVQNAPAARREERWLPGWRNRVTAYCQ